MRLLRGLNPVPTAEQRLLNKSTNKSIWQVYWPLALSWFFMAWEGQVAMWLVGLMPDNKVYQAGFLIVMGLAIFIESPVIDLLSTGTTLGTDKKRFEKITQFTLILMAWVTVAHCIVVFTPLYNLIAIDLLETKPHVAKAAWYGLAWMPLWSACVGWRRYRQGIMIRAGKTRPISWGTLVRVSTMAVSGLALYFGGFMIGLGVIGVSFTLAVFAEALYIHIVSKPVIADLPEGQLAPLDPYPSDNPDPQLSPIQTDNDRHPGESRDPQLSPIQAVGIRHPGESRDPQIPQEESSLPPGKGWGRTKSRIGMDTDLSLPQLFKFHLPLTASTMLMLTAPVLMTRALNQTAEPVIAMAAWQTAGTVTWLFRTFTFALPEAVISLYQKGRERLLSLFCFQVGGGLTLLMVLAHFARIDYLVFLRFFQSEPVVAERAALAFLWCAPLPLLNALMSYYRGLLTSHHITSARMLAILVALISLAVGLHFGLQLPLLGVVVASAALSLAHLVELATLALAWMRSAHNPPHKPIPS